MQSESQPVLNLRKRMALEGEELAAHKFRSGVTRMVARSELERWTRAVGHNDKATATSQSGRGVWGAVRKCCLEFLNFYGFLGPAMAPDDEPGPIVGIPSEALLRVLAIPAAWQDHYHFAACEDALFIELPEPPGALGLCFGNGTIIPLQLLYEGQPIKVLRRSWADGLEPHPALTNLGS